MSKHPVTIYIGHPPVELEFPMTKTRTGFVVSQPHKPRYTRAGGTTQTAGARYMAHGPIAPLSQPDGGLGGLLSLIAVVAALFIGMAVWNG
jgi:hypothetical protein